MDQIEPARAYIRSVTVHEDIQTVGRFSAVWVSDRLRSMLAHERSYLSGFCESNSWLLPGEKKQDVVWRPTFYLITLKKAKIDQECSPWKIFLCVGGQRYCPTYLARIELCNVTNLLLNSYLTVFADVYELGFSVPPEKLSGAILQLYFRSASKQAMVSWNTSLEHLFTPELFCDWRRLT